MILVIVDVRYVFFLFECTSRFYVMVNFSLICVEAIFVDISVNNLEPILLNQFFCLRSIRHEETHLQYRRFVSNKS